MTILIITTFVYSSQMYQTILETFKDIFSSWWFTVTYQQSYHFSYIHLTNNCSDSVQILVAVCSAPINILHRNTIRETWGQYARNNSNFKMVFFEGVTHSPGVQDDIHEESVKYGDIVQENYIDHYENLSLKSIAYLRWIYERADTKMLEVHQKQRAISEFLVTERETPVNIHKRVENVYKN
ncbi:beta-1,3-galactosyltransferase 1-like [Octopus vulgaris]|uniref:Hexosyltransferase n=1 Tax=Octopus vulgaris TaxID=6645 RepID=A0AA36APR6_OCTVU|nr:beta-1,3-galactosyltransferase 1-like [Octopus vulgaris]